VRAGSHSFQEEEAPQRASGASGSTQPAGDQYGTTRRMHSDFQESSAFSSLSSRFNQEESSHNEQPPLAERHGGAACNATNGVVASTAEHSAGLAHSGSTGSGGNASDSSHSETIASGGGHEDTHALLQSLLNKLDRAEQTFKCEWDDEEEVRRLEAEGLAVPPQAPRVAPVASEHISARGTPVALTARSGRELDDSASMPLASPHAHALGRALDEVRDRAAAKLRAERQASARALASMRAQLALTERQLADAQGAARSPRAAASDASAADAATMSDVTRDAAGQAPQARDLPLAAQPQQQQQQQQQQQPDTRALAAVHRMVLAAGARLAEMEALVAERMEPLARHVAGMKRRMVSAQEEAKELREEQEEAHAAAGSSPGTSGAHVRNLLATSRLFVTLAQVRAPCQCRVGSGLGKCLHRATLFEVCACLQQSGCVGERTARGGTTARAAPDEVASLLTQARSAAADAEQLRGDLEASRLRESSLRAQLDGQQPGDQLVAFDVHCGVVHENQALKDQIEQLKRDLEVMYMDDHFITGATNGGGGPSDMGHMSTANRLASLLAPSEMGSMMAVRTRRRSASLKSPCTLSVQTQHHLVLIKAAMSSACLAFFQTLVHPLHGLLQRGSFFGRSTRLSLSKSSSAANTLNKPPGLASGAYVPPLRKAGSRSPLLSPTSSSVLPGPPPRAPGGDASGTHSPALSRTGALLPAILSLTVLEHRIDHKAAASSMRQCSHARQRAWITAQAITFTIQAHQRASL
jgi:hypothetical protein